MHSPFSEAKNDSATALSQHYPVRPTDSVTSCSSASAAYWREVYLGTIVRCNPDSGDELHARTNRSVAHTGVDASEIWDWGTIHRVIAGLHSHQIGLQPFGDLLLAEADRLRG